MSHKVWYPGKILDRIAGRTGTQDGELGAELLAINLMRWVERTSILIREVQEAIVELEKFKALVNDIVLHDPEGRFGIGPSIRVYADNVTQKFLELASVIGEIQQLRLHEVLDRLQQAIKDPIISRQLSVIHGEIDSVVNSAKALLGSIRTLRY